MMRIFTAERADYAALAAGAEVPDYPDWPPRHLFAIPDA